MFHGGVQTPAPCPYQRPGLPRRCVLAAGHHGPHRLPSGPPACCPDIDLAPVLEAADAHTTVQALRCTSCGHPWLARTPAAPETTP